MKSIAFENGLVNFCLPDNWVEEEEEMGTGLFYPEGVMTQALRLEVMQFRAPKEVSQEFCLDMLRNMGKEEGGEVIALPSGNAVLHYQQEAKEGRQNLIVYNWEMANPLPPNTVRLAIFSYTILAADLEEAQATVQMLDEEIRNTQFR